MSYNLKPFYVLWTCKTSQVYEFEIFTYKYSQVMVVDPDLIWIQIKEKTLTNYGNLSMLVIAPYMYVS